MIIYASMLVLTVLFGIFYENSKKEKLSGLHNSHSAEICNQSNLKVEGNFVWLILILLVLIFVTGLQSGYGDTTNYWNQFKNLNYSFEESLSLVWGTEKSPLFRIYMALIKEFTNDPQWFLLITAIITNYFVWRVLRREAVSVPLACYYYICSGLFMWAMNGIRQYLVAALVFACYRWILDGKWLKWFLLLFVLYFCHTSVIFLVPMYFLYRRKPWTKITMLFIVGVLVIGMFYSQFSDAFFEVAEGTDFDEYSSQVDTVLSTSFLRVAFMIIPAILSFVLRKDIDKENSPILNLSVNASVVSAGMYLLAGIGAGNLIARIAVYSDLFVYIILVPYLIKKLLNSQYPYAAHFYIAAAGVFYCYQMFVVNGGIWYSYWLGWYFI